MKDCKFSYRTYRAEIGYFSGFSEAKKLVVSSKTSFCARDLASLDLQEPQSPSWRPPLRSLGAPPRTRGGSSREAPRRGLQWRASRLRGAQRFRSRGVYFTHFPIAPQQPDAAEDEPAARPTQSCACRALARPSQRHGATSSVPRTRRSRSSGRKPSRKDAVCGSFRLFRFP